MLLLTPCHPRMGWRLHTHVHGQMYNLCTTWIFWSSRTGFFEVSRTRIFWSSVTFICHRVCQLIIKSVTHCDTSRMLTLDLKRSKFVKKSSTSMFPTNIHFFFWKNMFGWEHPTLKSFLRLELGSFQVQGQHSRCVSGGSRTSIYLLYQIKWEVRVIHK